MDCVLVLTVLALAGCSTSSPSGAREVKFAGGQGVSTKIAEAQLQDDLLRFANRFSTLVQEGTRNLEESPDPKIRQQGLMRRLLYDSASLDIALGMSPEANLLDMVAFIDLGRLIWNEHWMPVVFGSQGLAMSRQFDRASEEIENIAGEVLTYPQRESLAKLIQEWREENPRQVAIENLRFSEFARETGARSQRLHDEVGGLLAGVEAATQVGDRALLLSERALFYAQRAPFLWRLQAQAGAREVLSAAIEALTQAREVADRQGQIRPILHDVTDLFGVLTQGLAQANEHPGTIRAGSEALSHLADVLHESNQILLNPKTRPGLSQLGGTAAVVDTQLNQLMWMAFALGVALCLVFGAVTLGARLAYHSLTQRSRRARDSRKSDRS